MTSHLFHAARPPQHVARLLLAALLSLILLAGLLAAVAWAGETESPRPPAATTGAMVGQPQARDIRYTYDAAGRLTEANYGDQRIAYTYDNAGNLLQARVEPVSERKLYLPILLRGAVGAVAPPAPDAVGRSGPGGPWPFALLGGGLALGAILTHPRRFTFQCEASLWDTSRFKAHASRATHFVMILLLLLPTLLPAAPSQAADPAAPAAPNAPEGGVVPTEPKSVTTGTSATTTEYHDPINMATGEYYFYQDLLGLGGPLPLDLRLYYGSQMGAFESDSKRMRDGLPARFTHSQGNTLFRSVLDTPNTIVVQTGMGNEIRFEQTARTTWTPFKPWRPIAREPAGYQLVETDDYYYLMDPLAETVATYVKSKDYYYLQAPRTQARVSVASTGSQANAGSLAPAITGDGRYVAFESDATNLVAGDTNGVRDIFLHDRHITQTVRVSVDSAGVQANAASYSATLSADARYVAFASLASNLAPGDNNAAADIFIHDWQTGQTTRASVSAAGAEADGASSEPALSADGRYVAFTSLAANLATLPTNGVSNVFVKDRQSGQVWLASVNATGTAAGNGPSAQPAISADGRYVAFTSLASDLVISDTNGVSDIFLWDRQTLAVTRVSVSWTAGQANGRAYDPTISADGNRIAFATAATNLERWLTDDNGKDDVYLRDRGAGNTLALSRESNASLFNGDSYRPRISPDGRYIAFVSTDTHYPEDRNAAAPDIFVRDQAVEHTRIVGRQGSAWTPTGSSLGSDWPAIAQSGLFIAFSSHFTDAVGSDANNAADVFVAERIEPANNLLVSLQDRNDNRLLYTNPATRFQNPGPLSIADGLGRAITFTYQTIVNGQPQFLTSVSDGYGRRVGFRYEVKPADNPSSGAFGGGVTLRAITDVLGSPLTFVYNGVTGGDLIAARTLPAGNTPYTQTYNPAYYGLPTGTRGVVQTQSDAYGNTATIQANQYRPYESSASVFTTTDPDGTQRSFAHDHGMRVTQALTDTTGQVATFLSDPVRNQVTGVTDRLGATTTLTYHASGKIARVANALGQTITHTYAAQAQTFANPVYVTETVTFTFYNLTRTDYPDGASEQVAYDARGNVMAYTDQAGQTWRFTCNPAGQPLTVANPAGGVITNTYNADGTLASTTDAETGATTYAYDAYKRPARITRADGATVQIAYDLKDRITAITDERGNATRYAYDANDNLVRVTDPVGQVANLSYDLLDRVSQITDRLGQTTRLSYDSMGRPAAVNDATGVATAYGYDPRGWLDQVTRGAANWRTGYDAEGIPTRVTTPSGHATSYASNALGLFTSATDALGRVSRLSYDALNRIAGITDGLNRTTAYSYDGRGLLTGVTLPLVGAAAYQYDSLGRLTRISDLNGQPWSFAYTPMGRLQGSTDPLGRATAQTYDNRGRPAQTAFPGGDTLDRTYDAVSNLARLQYSGGPDGSTTLTTSLRYTYDALDRLTATDGISLTHDAEGRVVNSADLTGLGFGATYDAAGRLKTASYADGALVVTYTYSPTTGLLMRVSDDVSGAGVDFSYDADFRLVGMARSNGVATALTWDAAGRLTRIRDEDLLDLQYTLDTAGQVTQLRMTAPLDPAASLQPTTSTLTFDAASQISSAGYAYDPRGRQTVAPGATYTWDAASRLTSIQLPASNVQLTYNGLGDVRTRAEGGATTYFYHNYALGLVPIVAEAREPGNRGAEEQGGSSPLPPSTPAPLRWYVYTPDGGLLYAVDAATGQPSFYHFDRTGSTLALTDAVAAVTDAYAYDPYGQLLAHTGTSTQPFTFVGQWGVRQEGAALYQMRARYYDAATQRFLSRDPIWPQITSAQEMNPYLYVHNSPLVYVDFTGMDEVADARQRYRDALKDLANLWSERAQWSGYPSGDLGAAEMVRMYDENIRKAQQRVENVKAYLDDLESWWKEHEKYLAEQRKQEAARLAEWRQWVDSFSPGVQTTETPKWSPVEKAAYEAEQQRRLRENPGIDWPGAEAPTISSSILDAVMARFLGKREAPNKPPVAARMETVEEFGKRMGWR